MKKEKYLSLYRIGKFYNAYNDDGIILHELLGYKYVEYKKSVGFPESALNKVRNKLEENHISYKIYEKEEIKESYKGYKEAYEKCFSLALKNLDMEKRINHARSIIDKCSTSDLTKILEVIENGSFK